MNSVQRGTLKDVLVGLVENNMDIIVHLPDIDDHPEAMQEANH